MGTVAVAHHTAGEDLAAATVLHEVAVTEADIAEAEEALRTVHTRSSPGQKVPSQTTRGSNMIGDNTARFWSLGGDRCPFSRGLRATQNWTGVGMDFVRCRTVLYYKIVDWNDWLFLAAMRGYCSFSAHLHSQVEDVAWLSDFLISLLHWDLLSRACVPPWAIYHFIIRNMMEEKRQVS